MIEPVHLKRQSTTCTTLHSTSHNVVAADLDITVACFLEDCCHILTHEVHTQHSHCGTALLRHGDCSVCHDQTVADMDVRPASSCTGEHPLHLWVHIEVGHNANLLLRQHLQRSGITPIELLNNMKSRPQTLKHKPGNAASGHVGSTTVYKPSNRLVAIQTAAVSVNIRYKCQPCSQRVTCYKKVYTARIAFCTLTRALTSSAFGAKYCA